MKRKILIFCFVAVAAITVFNTIATKSPNSDKRLGLYPDPPTPKPEPPSEPKPNFI